MNNFPLTEGQLAAETAFNNFVIDEEQQVFVLEGYSGCGKSYLVRHLLDNLPAFLKTMKLVNPNQRYYEPKLTATTNKAAENLAQLSGMDVVTIHSFLGLRVVNDWARNTSKLVPRVMTPPEGYLVFVDEASFMDSDVLGYLFSQTKNCKFVLIGDPAQLVDMKSVTSPAFAAGFPTVALTEVVRQPKPEGGLEEIHPITAWATALREVVNTGIWTPLQPDGFHIQHLDRDTFNERVLAEFTRPDWKNKDSKVLAWTNKTVVAYNHFIQDHMKGTPELVVGDYAVNNSYLSIDRVNLKTDELVHITGIGPDVYEHGVLGNVFEINERVKAFMPKSLADRKEAIKQAHQQKQLGIVQYIEQMWIDLRSAASCTINKAQGSTYDSVYIDVDDIGKCTNGNTLARLLYVGISRARHHVFLTGDLA